MLQNFNQSHNWLFSEPLLFDDEIYESMSLMDFQSLPTPPQSPPMKAGAAASNPLSKEDQLSYVSNILLEDQDMQFNWTCDFFQPEGKGKEEAGPCSPEEDGGEEGLWQCLAGGRTLGEKLVLGSSPLLPEMNTGIFEGMADSMLDCQSLMTGQEQPGEATSDYGSTGGELSTCSSSDSGESQSTWLRSLLVLCRVVLGSVVVTHLWWLHICGNSPLTTAAPAFESTIRC